MKKIIVFLLVVTVCLTSCSKKEQMEFVENEEIVTAVKTEKVTKATLYDSIRTNGNVRVNSSLEVYSLVNGRLVKNEMYLGKKVNKGDVIAVIDPSITGGRYALHEVISPISGTVLLNPIQTGSLISSETKLTVIGDLSSLQIVAYIPERFYGKLKKGLSGKLFAEAFPEEKFDAKITYISPVIDENSRTCEVFLSVENKNNKIVAGMFVDIILFLNSYEDVISVPSNCISSRDGENFVYILDDKNHAKLQKVEIYKAVENRVIISSGLIENNKVITEGYETLVDGALVNIVSEQK